jgi:hypothetical protein
MGSEKTYYKTSQFIPTKGESFSFYECDGDFQVERFMTYIPETEELERVEVDWTMELREDGAEEIDRDEFIDHWEKGEDDEVQ